MDKLSFEKMLLDPEGWRALGDKLRAFHNEADLDISGAPRSSVARSPRKRPPDAVIKRSDRFVRKWWRQADLFPRGADGTQITSEAYLHEAIQFFEKKPSASAALKLEMAINRTTISSSAGRTRELVCRAKHLLAKKIKAEDFEGDNVAAEIFKDIEFGGSNLFLSLPLGGRYTGFQNLKQQHFNDEASSMTVSCSSDEFLGDLFLFQDARYMGRYVKLETTAGVTTGELSISNFMDNKASSVLLYRRGQGEIAQSVGNVVSPSEIAPIINSQDHLHSRGNPIFTWDLYPDGKDGHPNSSFMTYIYVRIPVTVDPPHWAFNYDAEIRFWIYAFVDEVGDLNFQVDYYGAWVEGGVISGKILSELMKKIPDSLDELEGLLMSASGIANLAAPFSEVYMLPGKNADQGSTQDDVTLVLVQGKPIPPPPIQ